ncbi:MAG: hypothetical protein MPN21_13590 [Thermoanaerobaculia bacterium]|nr:hypothetical protein [Thermoanaerobaculia bacterium]
MIYTKSAFGNALRVQLALGYEPRRLARWAYAKYLDHANELESGLYDELMKIATMEQDPQFELTKEEIEQLARNLLTD